MAGEVCARCLWTGPATSAPDGTCPVCGSPLPRAHAAKGPETPSMADAPTTAHAADMLAPSAYADAATTLDTADDSYMADLTSAPSGDGEYIGSEANGRSSGRPAISRGRWALLAVNVALLVVCVALMASTALGWRANVAGIANASSASPNATATTPASVIPSTGPDALLPTPTATTTPTPNPNGSGGSGGGFAPTATPTTPPTVAPTPRPTAPGGGN